MLLALSSPSLLLRPPPTLPPAQAEALRLTAFEHAAAVAAQEVRWALDYEPLPHTFTDSDFEIATRVPPSYAGPDAASLHDGGIVHETTAPILASHECTRLIAEVESMLCTRESNPLTYGQGQGDTLYAVPAVERRVVHVHAMSVFGSTWLQQKLRTHFFPMVAERYGLDPWQLAVDDALIVGYDAAVNATQMPAHRDSALVTVNVALSDAADYEGGGTLIEASGAVLRMDQGHAALHASGVRHAGHHITAGRRWVMVLFVVSREVPQLAWRCAEHAAISKVQAQEAMRDNRDPAQVVAALEAAEVYLEAAASLAPADHEILHARCGLHAMRGEEAEARQCAAKAVAAYPPCPKPKIALGSLLLKSGRTRGALRHFEAALAVAVARRGEEAEDGDDAWEARCNGGLAVIRLLQQYRTSPTPLPTATAWLRRALAAAPEDARLISLLKEARALEPTLS